MSKIACGQYQHEGEQQGYRKVQAAPVAGDQDRIVEQGTGGADDEISARLMAASRRLQHANTIA